MSVPTLLTVKQFNQKHPAFPIGGLRHHIFHENQNGMKATGVVVRNGRAILINESRYFLWLELKNTGELDPVLQLLRTAKKEGRYLAPEEAVDRVRGRSDVA